MFRTIIKRSDIVKSSVKKVARFNASRTISIECSKRLQQKFSLVSQTKVPTWTSSYNQIRHYSANYPPHTRVTLPALSPTMEEGTIISWEKKEGDKLNEGDLLAEIETDKATMAFETPEEGYLAKILIPAGTKGIPIGKLVCIIVENESDVAAFKDFKDDGVIAPAPSAAAAAPSAAAPAAPTPPMVAPPSVGPSSPPAAGGRVYASPMAKRLAEQRNIRLQGKGTGMFGSITSSDLDRMAAAAPASSVAPSPAAQPPGTITTPGAAYVDIPVNNVRAVIAKRLLDSKTTIPHYYLSIDVNVDKLMALRTKFNKKLEKEGTKVSVNDFVIKAAAMASNKVPEANSQWFGTFIRRFKNVDVSVAVSTDNGLITPIIFEANNKGIVKISSEMKMLAAKAREGKLQPQEFQGGTISISNLGMYGIDQFCAIINPPQSAILAASGINSKIVIDDTIQKGFKEIKVMNLTLCCDHRVLDGAVGAKWLQALRDYMQDPVMMIL